MNERASKTLTVVDFFGKSHEFSTTKGPEVKIENSMLLATLDNGIFCQPLDMVRYFQIQVVHDNQQQRFAACEIQLTTIEGDTAGPIHIENIINYEWKIHNGLLMIYAMNSVTGFHLDCVISFYLTNP